MPVFPRDPIELVLSFFLKFELRIMISDNFKIVSRRLIHFWGSFLGYDNYNLVKFGKILPNRSARPFS